MRERDEPDREIQGDEQALEEIRVLFARYRRKARHGMVSDRDEQTELGAEESKEVPALADR